MAGETQLTLPEDLGQRRQVLEEELDKTITILTTNSLTKSLVELFRKFGLEGQFSVSWDFYPESDDEGGSYMSISDVSVESSTDSDFSADEVTAELSYSWGNGTYTAQLDDEIRDVLSGFESDIYKSDMDDITVTIQKGE
ncbi:hypothetical protein [Rossellomorea marisflavi]|uniref:hypothetical protein n=1 Tax=Rossellomorea marisflavi TaxID=189381 RepID=UPI003F9F93E9